MQKEAQEYVKKCDQCQRFAPNIPQPGGVLNPLSSPWPFAQRGLDIVGPFPKAVGNKKYLLVCTIISLSGLKLSLWLISGMWMLKGSSERILLHDLRFLTRSSQIMVFNLIAKLLGNTVPIWV